MFRKKDIPKRVVIYSRDVENITGCATRTAQAILQNIRKALGKEKFQFVTVREFCFFMGIEEELVKQCILD
jgi:hypothetical protein